MIDTSCTRRQFLRSAAAASLGGLAVNLPLAVPATENKADGPESAADTLIILWMAGGMAHTETFDPKRYTPFEPGLASSEVLSTFPAIDTAVDHIKISEGLEHIAQVMDRGTLIRSHVAADLGAILHSRHQYHWHTGYEPPLTVAAPHLGAWLSYALGPKNPALPAFIDIGQRYAGNGEAEELKAFQTGGFLGSDHGPFRIPDPAQAVQAIRPPAGMSRERFQERYQAYRKLVATATGDLESRHKESLLRALEKANRLMDSPASKAFDLSLEPRSVYESYDAGPFGLGCLSPGVSPRRGPAASRSRPSTFRSSAGTHTTTATRGRGN